MAVISPVAILIPGFLKAVFNYLLSQQCVPATVGSAHVEFKWNKGLEATMIANDFQIPNPDGFEKDNLLTVEKLAVSFTAADLAHRLLSRCVDLRAVAVAGVTVRLEHRDGAGLNAGVLGRRIAADRAARRGAALPPEVTDAGAEESAIGLLSLVGIVDSADKVLVSAREEIHEAGGLSRFVKAQLKSKAGVATGVLQEAHDGLRSKVKDAGGVSNLLQQTAGDLLETVADKAQQAQRAGKEGGVLREGGLLDFVKGELTGTASAITDKAEDVMLQQDLHRKLLGCYKEEPGTWYLRVDSIRVERVLVHARGLLKKEERARAGVGLLELPLLPLGPDELAPHPKAVPRGDGALPVAEALRRVKVVLSHGMRRHNKAALLDLASAGVRERLTVPGWLLPKGGRQSAAGYVKDLGEGLGSTVAKAPALVGKLGQAAPKAASGVIQGAGKILGGVLAATGEVLEETGRTSSAGSAGGRPASTSAALAASSGDVGEQLRERVLASAGEAIESVDKLLTDRKAPDADHKVVRSMHGFGGSFREQILSSAQDAVKDAPAAVVKGAGDILGGVVGGAEAALSNVSRIRTAGDAGDVAKGALGKVGETGADAVAHVSNALGGAIGGFFAGLDRSRARAAQAQPRTGGGGGQRFEM